MNEKHLLESPSIQRANVWHLAKRPILGLISTENPIVYKGYKIRLRKYKLTPNFVLKII